MNEKPTKEAEGWRVIGGRGTALSALARRLSGLLCGWVRVGDYISERSFAIEII